MSVDVACVFRWTLGAVCVRVRYVGSTGQIEQVTDYPVRSNQVCEREEEGGGASRDVP